jgi:hypothetical protein
MARCHLVDMIVIGPDGTALREYNGRIVSAKTRLSCAIYTA